MSFAIIKHLLTFVVIDIINNIIASFYLRNDLII